MVYYCTGVLSSISQTLKVGKSDKLYGRLNVPVSVSVLDPVAVPANSIGMVSVSFPKFPPLRAVSVLPSDIKAGSTAKVTVRFGNYDLDDGPVGLTVVPGTALSVGVTKNYKAKVNNWAVGGKIEATITASPSASAGARLLRLSAECREPGTLPFSVVVTKPPAPPPPAVTTTNIVYSKHVPFQGQYAYKAWVSIPNAKLQTVKNPDLGLGKQWLVRIPKSAKVGSEDCNKSAADFVNLDPGQSTTAFNGISMYQWGSWVCLVPKSQFTLVQGYPPKWTLEMSYTK